MIRVTTPGTTSLSTTVARCQRVSRQQPSFPPPCLDVCGHRVLSPIPVPRRRSRTSKSNIVNAAAGSLVLSDDRFEHISNPTGLSALAARIRSIAFFATSLVISLPLFFCMLAVFPLVLLFDKHRRRAEHFFNLVWAKLSMMLFCPVEVEGKENLPAPHEAAVYVANHLSILDIFALFHLNRPFKFISKTSNFLIPIVGWSMFMTGHIMINRVDKKSQIACLKQCGTVLANGASVLFFPEGTRSTDFRMHAFKKGAFSVAAKAGVPVVPITLVNTGDRMPNGKEYLMYNGKIKIIVHPPLPPCKDADALMGQSRDVIASSLPPERVATE